MAYDAALADRVREHLAPFASDLAEIEMFGGLCFTIKGNMAVGIGRAGELYVRFDKARHDEILSQPHVGPMQPGGRTMTGFAAVAPEGYATDERFAGWIDLCTAYVGPMPPKKPRKRKPRS